MLGLARPFSFALAGTVIALAALPTAAAGNQGAQAYTVRYSVPSGRLEQALQRLLEHSSLQLVYPPALVGARTSPGARDAATAEEALAQILRGTGLTAVEIAPRTYLLRSLPSKPLAPAASNADREPARLPPVQVTGTRIPRQSLQVSTPIVVYTAEDIRTSGRGTLFDFLRLSPHVTAQHPRDLSTRYGSALNTPAALTPAASLYTLGTRSTLILVDGMRMPSSGMTSPLLGSVNDLAGLPMSMIDRVEIVGGSASSVYGSDAMAGVINIVLKRDIEGGVVAAQSGMSARGDAMRTGLSVGLGGATQAGDRWSLFADRSSDDGLVGRQRNWATLKSRDRGTDDRRLPYTLAVGAGSRLDDECIASASAPGRSTCYLDRPRYSSLVPESESASALLNYRHSFGAGLEGKAALRLSRSKVRMHYPPAVIASTLRINYQQHVFHDVGPIAADSGSYDTDAQVGLDGSGSRWSWESLWFYRTNRTENKLAGVVNIGASFDPLAELAQFGYRMDGGNSPQTLARTAAPNRLEGRYTDYGTDARIGGPLADLRHGPIQSVFGLELRREQLRSSAQLATRADGYRVYADALGDWSRNNGRRSRISHYGEVSVPAARGLDLDLAWRVDRDSSFATQFTPRMGVKWEPVDGLVLRGSHGQGYRAPSLYESRAPTFEGVILASPRTVPSCLQQWPGTCALKIVPVGRSSLKPERSRSTTFGLAWSAWPGVDIALDHYAIRRYDEINPFFDYDPARVVRNADGAVVGIPFTPRNFGASEIRGWQFDGGLRHGVDNDGRIELRVQANYLDRWRSRASRREGEMAGRRSPRVHASALLRASWPRWSASASLRYRGRLLKDPTPNAELVPLLLGNARLSRDLPSMTTADLYLRYDNAKDWSLGLHVLNVADRVPKNYSGNVGGYTLADDDPIGRYWLLDFERRF